MALIDRGYKLDLGKVASIDLPCLGETLNSNHNDCPSGTDTKKRLYLTGKEKGILWYCHNCSNGGFVRTSASTPKYTRPANSVPSPNNNGHSKWCTLSTRRDGGVHDGLVLPATLRRHDEDYEYRAVYRTYDVESFVGDGWGGYQRRSKHNVPPKYTWVKNPNLHAATYMYRSGSSIPDKSIVIVEDMISGWTLSRRFYPAYVMYGTSFNITDFYTHYKQRDEQVSTIYVWLDNDNPTVDDIALDIKHKVACFHKDVKIVQKNFKDPKHYTTPGINEALGNAR